MSNTRFEPTNKLRVAKWTERVKSNVDPMKHPVGKPIPTKIVERQAIQQLWYCVKTGKEEWRFLEEVNLEASEV